MPKSSLNPSFAYSFTATVQKIVSEILPPSEGVAFAKEARDLLIECCVEFITLISSEANEISEKEAKKTIACDHITKALEQLGFTDYVPAVLEAAAEHKEVQKVRTVHHFLVHHPLTQRRAERRRRTSLPAVACPWRSWLVYRKSSSRRRGNATASCLCTRWMGMGIIISALLGVERTGTGLDLDWMDPWVLLSGSGLALYHFRS